MWQQWFQPHGCGNGCYNHATRRLPTIAGAMAYMPLWLQQHRCSNGWHSHVRGTHPRLMGQCACMQQWLRQRRCGNSRHNHVMGGLTAVAGAMHSYATVAAATWVWQWLLRPCDVAPAHGCQGNTHAAMVVTASVGGAQPQQWSNVVFMLRCSNHSGYTRFTSRPLRQHCDEDTNILGRKMGSRHTGGDDDDDDAEQRPLWSNVPFGATSPTSGRTGAEAAGAEAVAAAALRVGLHLAFSRWWRSKHGCSLELHALPSKTFQKGNAQSSQVV